MIGFLTGISVNIVCGQIAGLTGASAHGDFPLGQGRQRAHPSGQHPAGVAADRAERARDPAGAGPDPPVGGQRADRPGDPDRRGGARRRGHGGQGRGPGRHSRAASRCRSCPTSRLLSFSLVTGALAMAAIILVQGAGVAEAVPNPALRSRIRTRTSSRKGRATWPRVSSVASRSGARSVSTALNVTVGGKTRWATIWSGVWMLVILALFSGLVAKIAVPTLGAILIFAAIGSLRPGEVATIMRTGRTSQVVVITTFAATLVPAGRRGGRHRGGPVAAAAAQPGGHGPRRRRADPAC